MKIFAGEKLNLKNPKQHALNVSRIITIASEPLLKMVQIARKNEEIAARPAAIPSKPSIKLNALMMMTLHPMVIANPNGTGIGKLKNVEIPAPSK